MILVDTSALYALLAEDDPWYERVVEAWGTALRDDRVVTHDRVIVEASALVQRRFGMRAARRLHEDLLPAVATVALTERLAADARDRWLAADRRRLSLVDVTSFVLMEELGITTALALDDDFADEGFEVLPASRGR